MTASNISLNGWRVLVTRPRPQGDRLARTLEDYGAHVVLVPLVTIEPQTPQNAGLLNDLSHYDKVVAISATAVEQAFGHKPGKPESPCWYVPGAATAAALARYGVQAQYPRTGVTSEDLLTLPGLQDLHRQRILLLKGEGGRNLMAREFQKRGASLDCLVLYRRRCPSYQPGYLDRIVQDSRVGAMVATSGQIVRHLLQISLHPETLQAVPLLVPGARVARLARLAGFHSVKVMAGADDAAVVSALAHMGSEETYKKSGPQSCAGMASAAGRATSGK
ncbi:MAG: uroporphyrinogen-III synthase [Kistimonas sp.]|nr:uroporphyrinogen-III synthase [Kistimonas sp.]